MTATVTIDSRFRGPQDSGNGGYSCGVIARHVDSPVVEVTLRVPPPLDTPMALREADGGIDMLDGETLVAEARPAEGLDIAIPEPVSLEQAQAGREDSGLNKFTPYPDCFVCSPEREAGDGLHITPGPVEGREELLASPWDTSATLPLEAGAVSPDIVWAALDCPGGVAVILMPDAGLCVLGRLTAQIHAPVLPETSYVAIGWPTERDGRKIGAGTAIFTPDGELVAASKATWIELKEEAQPTQA